MTLELRLAAEGQPTPFEGPRVRVTLANPGGPGLEVPPLDDPVGPLELEATRAEGGGRVMSGATQHLLRCTGRLPAEPLFLRPLPAGGQLEETLDCGTLHLPLPEGRWRLRGRLRHGRLEATSNELELVVPDVDLQAVEAVRDDPVTELLTLLFTARDAAGAVRRTLRAVGPGKPIAAWYSRGVLADAPAEAAPSISATGYHQTDDFAPAFSRWLVWAEGDRARARRHEWGQPAADRAAPLPGGHRLLPGAWTEQDGTLRVFTRGPGGPVVCHVLAEAGLERPVHVTPSERDLEVAAVAAGGGDALVLWRQGEDLHLHRVDLADGQVRERRPIVTGRGRRLRSARFGMHLREVLTCHAAPDGRDALLVATPLEGAAEPVRATLAPESWVTRPPRELAFDIQRGRAHVAWSDGAALWHGSAAGDTLKLAEGPGPFFPVVCGGVRTYVGFAEPGRGHRFVELERGGGGFRDFAGLD